MIQAICDRTLCQVLGRWVADLDISSVPTEVCLAARLHLLDTLAALLAGSQEEEEVLGILRAYAQIEGSGPILVLPRGPRLPLLGAVACQAALTSLAEIDDVHGAAVLRPGALVVPAILACAQSRSIPGRGFLAALVAGYEVGSRIGANLDGQWLLARGLWPSSVSGPLAAAAAVSKVLELSAEQTAQALAIAGLFAGGLVTGAGEGATARHLVFGGAVRAGAKAAMAAVAGLTGPLRLFEDRRGFLNAFGSGQKSGESLPEVSADLGRRFALLETGYKLYPCARQTHTALDALTQLLSEQRLTARELTDIMVALPPNAMLVVDKPEPPGNRLAALSSVQFVLAALAVRGRVGLAELSSQARRNSEILDLQRRVFAQADPALTGAAARVRVRSRSGEWERTLVVPRGDTAAPVSAAVVYDKFESYAASVVGVRTAREIASLVGRLEELEDAGALVTMLALPES